MARTAPRPRPALLEHLGHLTVVALSLKCLFSVTFSSELLQEWTNPEPVSRVTQQVSAKQRTELMREARREGRELTRLCAYHLPGGH